MKLDKKPLTDSPGLNIKQKRSKKTYNALIKAGFSLFKKREWDSITVADISRSAGYSVGAFYTRFRSKDDFFDALVAHQLKAREADLERLYSTLSDDEFIDELIKDIIQYHWKNRKYWRAALVRGMRDPDFWKPIRLTGHDVAGKTIAKLSEQADRPLTDMEEINVRFAFQITFGNINNAIINQPGPIFMNHKLFVKKLTQAFRLVAGCDNFKK